MGPKRLSRILFFVLLAIVGLCATGLGAAVVVTARAVHPVQVEGTIADYKEVSVDGTYSHNELRLAGDATTYIVDRRLLHPALPERLLRDGKVSLWVDAGTTTVLAISLYDQLGLNPTLYSSGDYDNPALAERIQQIKGVGTAAIGLALLGLAVVRVRRRRAPQITRTHNRIPAPAVASPALAAAYERAPATPGTSKEHTVTQPPARSTAFDRMPMPSPRTPGDPATIDQLATMRTPAVAPATSHPPAALPPQPERESIGALDDIEKLATVRTPAMPTAAYDAHPTAEFGDPYGAQTPAPYTPWDLFAPTGAAAPISEEPATRFDRSDATGEPNGPLASSIDQQPTARTPAVHMTGIAQEWPLPAPPITSDPAPVPANLAAAPVWESTWGLPLPERDAGGAGHSHNRLTPLSLSGAGQRGEQPQHPWGVAWGVPSSQKAIDEQPTERTPAVPPTRDAHGQPPDQNASDD